MREPAKVLGCLLGGLADNWHVQAAADHASAAAANPFCSARVHCQAEPMLASYSGGRLRGSSRSS